MDEAGTQKITQKEPAVFIQDVWQPMPNLTIQAGLRWEAQVEPDPITPPDQVFFAAFIGKTVNGQTFPSDGTIPSDWKMWQPRVGDLLRPVEGRQDRLPRATSASSTPGSPGSSWPRPARPTAASARSIDRGSTFRNFGGPLPPAYTQLVPASQTSARPDHPGVFVTSSDFQNPRTAAWSASVEREVLPGWAALLKYNYAKTTHLTRFVNRNAAELGSPWSTGLGPDGTNGVGSAHDGRVQRRRASTGAGPSA